MSMKNSNDTIWDRTGDLPFRFVAQHLNHCATAVPLHTGYWSKIIPFDELHHNLHIFSLDIVKALSEILRKSIPNHSGRLGQRPHLPIIELQQNFTNGLRHTDRILVSCSVHHTIMNEETTAWCNKDTIMNEETTAWCNKDTIMNEETPAWCNKVEYIFHSVLFSTCFGWDITHHQELQDCTIQIWYNCSQICP